MAKGWIKEPRRHSLSARGIKNATNNTLTESRMKKEKYSARENIGDGGKPNRSKKRKNLYLELNAKIRKDIDEFPMFFAFNQEQFDEGLKKLGTKKEELISIGAGGFIKKSDKEKFIAMNKENDEKHKNLMKNSDYAYDMFRYELANHEYGYTYDDEDTLSSLNLTRKEVEQNKMLKTQLEKAKKDYLKNVEL